MTAFVRVARGTVVLVSLATLLQACIQAPARPDDPAFAPVYVPQPALPPATPGGVYQDGGALALFVDRRALRVGDIITIQLDEQFQSTKSNETKISRASDTSVEQPTVFGKILNSIGSGAGLVASLGSSTDFKGKGNSDQSNSLSGTLTVTVNEVMPNGLMVVQGEKWLSLNQGEEFVRISGLVRTEDVSPENSVSSQRVANARISYGGRGALTDSNSVGWLARFFLSPIWVF